MKHKIHPQYYKSAKVRCACGAEHEFGAPYEKMSVEICSKCHPFYTGEEKLLDIAGRVEKFKARRVKAATATTRKKSEKKAAKKARKAK
ncbi:MAG: 50S ribosomal protein L31 [Candidatus Liptonbacteria bacterium]|nr:50S ribosomal protein L31 [Candidatus Liptonbacteria bacterium]